MTVDSAEEETTSVRLTDVDTEEHLHIVEQEEEEGEDMEEEDDEIVDMACETLSDASSPQRLSLISSSPITLATLLPTSDSPHSSSESSVVASEGLNGPPQPEKRHICDDCGKGFPYFSILEAHKRCHTGEKPFDCHFCEKKFAQKATLQVHERTHTGERPYKCRYCEKTFAQYGTKTVHEKSAHLGIRNYKCPKCDKCLSSPSALYTHKKTHGEKAYNCQFCPKKFTLKNYLKLHVKQVHEQNERKHICKYCPKSFAYAGSLQVHERTHTGERPYRCQFCIKAFASQGNLQSHERTHTGERPYNCGTCGRSFIQKSQLTAHEATHNMPNGGSRKESMTSSINNNNNNNDENSLKNEDGKKNDFACKYCGQRYAYASSLSVHMRLHTGERPFRCQFCDKVFTNQGNMLVHIRVHTGERPYSCSGCNKSYAQKVGLKIHWEQCQAYIEQQKIEGSADDNMEQRLKPYPNIYEEAASYLRQPITYPTITPDLNLFGDLTQGFRFPQNFVQELDMKPRPFTLPTTQTQTTTLADTLNTLSNLSNLSAFTVPIRTLDQSQTPDLTSNSLIQGLLETMQNGGSQPNLSNNIFNTQFLLQQINNTNNLQSAVASLAAATPLPAPQPIFSPFFPALQNLNGLTGLPTVKTETMLV